jgi:hypothetical protein
LMHMATLKRLLGGTQKLRDELMNHRKEAKSTQLD